MGWFRRLRAWLATPPLMTLARSTRVVWDETGAAVEADDAIPARYRRRFLWSEVVRVCFKDNGLAPDAIYVQARGADEPVMFVLEAPGGEQLFAELTRRGLFPEPVRTRAVRSVDGGWYCWPEHDEHA